MSGRHHLTLAGLTSLGLGTAALATGGIFGTWNATYPTSLSGAQASCALCHGSTGSGDRFNAYGWSIKEARDDGASTPEAFAIVESFDADGDPTGSTNLEEILAHAQPGWTEGAVNRIYDEDGSFQDGQSPPADVVGDLDPAVMCLGDLDGDGAIGVSDLLTVLADWGCAVDCAGDADGNGVVGVGDLLVVLAEWGPC